MQVRILFLGPLGLLPSVLLLLQRQCLSVCLAIYLPPKPVNYSVAMLLVWFDQVFTEEIVILQFRTKLIHDKRTYCKFCA